MSTPVCEDPEHCVVCATENTEETDNFENICFLCGKNERNYPCQLCFSCCRKTDHMYCTFPSEDNVKDVLEMLDSYYFIR